MYRVLLGVLLAALVVPTATATTSVDPGLRAAVAAVKRRGYTPATRTWHRDLRLNVLIGTKTGSADGYMKRAFFFVKGRGFVGIDSRAPSLQVFDLWQDDTTAALLYILYRRNDANCCPTGGGKIVRFRWTGTRLRALDRIPTANPNAPVHR